MTDAHRASSSAPEPPRGACPPPIAIVGIGCRFPGGVTDTESFWRLLCEGRHAIREVPADRWNVTRYHDASGDTAGTSVSRWGGFIDPLKDFDARFWGLSPREAARMDPQQRWLLEVAWEALEDSGTAPSRLAGANVGVFVGIAGNDYGGLQLQDPEHVDAYTNSGNTASIASNRVSYMLDLRGPSVSIDTACSSSLVAVWTACTNIWSGACVSALAGGVNALISPQVTIGFSKASMLSPDGRCFAFDARGNGYVRAEGAGMVFLKPLDRAVADGDRIYAVIRGVAVNQDGRTSSMTVPSVDGQVDMLRAAYAQAGIDPSRVSYVEAHGTGTPVGDPIEAEALGRVIGAHRAAGESCPIGSVKTNIGHLEAASGVAGLIKAALVAERGWIPASLNYEQPNPRIPFPALRLRVEHCGASLTAGSERAIVGVNSFGFGGTNAHVVLEAPPVAAERTPPADERAIRPFALAISARGDEALRAYVRRFREPLSSIPSQGIADLCAAAGARKEQHSQRLVLIGSSARAIDERARAWLRDGHAHGAVFGRANGAGRPVFVFTGQGAQWWAMGRQLIAREPIVRRMFEQVDAALQPFRGWSLIDEMRRDETQSRIDRTDIAQPALFALQIALAELWRSWGIVPAAVIGHSVGEVAAAYCAGVYTFDEAIAIIHHRSELQQRTQGLGGMLAAAISADAARELTATIKGVELAAVNSPSLVTLSGEHDGLDCARACLTRDGIYNRRLRIEYAFHSRQMDPLREELLDRLRDIQARSSTVPFYSTVTGGPLAGESLDGRYWWDNVRQPVLFASAAANLVSDGHDVYVELGPHPALESSLKDALAAANQTGTVLHSLKRDADDSEELLTNLAALHVAGAAIDWTAVNQGSGTVVRLPPYPWNRETYWAEPLRVAERRTGADAHPLLGTRVDGVQPTWQAAIDPRRLRYLADHRVWERAVFPAAGFAEMALAVAAQMFPGEPHRVEDLEISAALMLADDEPTLVQTVFDRDGRSVTVHSRNRDGAWQVHARSTILPAAANAASRLREIERTQTSGERHSHERYRAECIERGYQFGERFQQIRQLWCGEHEGLAEIVIPDEIAASLDAYALHPAVLDACFQSFLSLQAAGASTRNGTLLLPQSIGRIAVHRTLTPGRLFALARLVSDEGDTLTANIRVALPDGTPVADITGFCLARVDRLRPDSLEGCFFRFEWIPRHLRGAGARGSCEFASSAELVSAAWAASDRIRAATGFDDYRRESGMRRTIFAHLIVNAFRELGWQPARGDDVTLATLIDALGIVAEHARISRVLVGELAHAGWLHERGPDQWKVVAAVPGSIDAAAELDRLERAHPASAIDLGFARRTGLQLAAILSGEIDPIPLIFPDGSAEIVEPLYTRGSGFAAHLETFRVTLARALAALPNGRSLRVLEIGAGTGTLTRQVLSVVPPHRTEYLFTDIGQSFLAAAQAQFASHPFIEYHVFDLERDPVPQGIPRNRFDLVVASNVLHATADLRQTLAHVRETLAPGGLLLFLEVVSAEWALANITFGLLKGWWRVADDDLRPVSPWIESTRWLQLLGDAGFCDVSSVTCTLDPTESEHATLIAFAPDAAADEPEPTQPVATRDYLVLADEGGVGDAVAAQFIAAGHCCATVRAKGVRSIADVSRAIARDLDSDTIAGVIHCWTLDNPAADQADLDSMQAAQMGLMAGYSLVQQLRERTTPVWFVTRHTASVANADRIDGLAAAPLTGLARVANSEHQCRFAVIDLDSCSTEDAAVYLCDEVLQPRDGEFEIAYRDGVRHVLRLVPVRPEAFEPRTFAAIKADGGVVPFRLQTSKPGILTNLALHATSRSEPQAGEIEVRVQAGGLNFRDVMKALGTHPGHPIDLRWFGDDFAGVVERVGEGVETVRRGDAVAGMAPYAFRSFATTDARMAFAKPASMSFEEAATLPTAFLTAHYALNELARLQPGERVLIHAAAGGVGQAAMQVARASGLEIFATAGTPEKRQLLRQMGAAFVMSSRSLDFADEIMDVTHGRGVDAVLNSLAGDFIPKSVSVLAPFGRFLEIGKVDIYRNARIGLRSLRNNISYFVVDLTQHLRDKPEVIARLFGELAARFAAGMYQPLPSTVFPIANVADAFRHMAQARHVGKNVLAFDPTDLKIAYANEPGQRFRPEATYLITGGNGGFGLEVAKWIAREGGRHLVLVSRSGPRDPDAAAAMDALRDSGVEVVDARGDVARPADVDRIVTHVRETMPPLRGVFHAAMVLDDELAADLDEARIRRVLDPKLAGAWNLHRATATFELDHFVCFSSFSAVLALPRQSNYNAGNVFLDQLAHYRRARGLPAMSINFGALAGAGYVERELKTSAALTRLGAGTFEVDEALRVLERLLFADVTQVGAARVDWGRIQQLTPLVAGSNTYVPVRAARETAARRASMVAQLQAAPDEQRISLIEEFIASQVAAVFGTPADRIDRSASLTSLGLDSLMVLELTNRLERELNFRIPMGALLGGPTVVELARTVLRLMPPALDGPEEPTGVRATDRSEASRRSRNGATTALPAGGSSHLVMLRAGGDASPFFAIHPVGGGVAIYSPIAAHLPSDAAVYGVESRMNLGGHREYASLDEMVERYAAAIRGCSDEPYRLLGFSLGGYLAARIAEGLERSGLLVECVGVIDWDLQDRRSREAQHDSLVRMAVAAYHFAQADVGLVRPLDERRLHREIAGIVDRILREDPADGGELFYDWVIDNQLIASPALENVTRQHLSRFEQHCRLLAGSLPLPHFDAPLCVWRAVDGFGSRLADWQHQGEYNREHLVAGDHNAVIRPEGLALIGRQLTEFVSSTAAGPIGAERGSPA